MPLQNVELEKKQEDKRTVEELLELINGKDEGTMSIFLAS